MKVKLDKPYSWMGKSYEAGEANIPEDMAIALNLQKPKAETKKLDSAKEQLKPEPTFEAVIEPAKK